ncbi:hypothetical protein CDAR_15861 [Caerostris darwini]|uniref:Uncharacterized protein n=1 Tax=Caerostris darwini TaxID=1538125 RepID=A0AAV4NAN6_9ARAC|nr:hypothetical protein CDAR_15861 [Caerostris darwini]
MIGVVAALVFVAGIAVFIIKMRDEEREASSREGPAREKSRVTPEMINAFGQFKLFTELFAFAFTTNQPRSPGGIAIQSATLASHPPHLYSQGVL